MKKKQQQKVSMFVLIWCIALHEMGGVFCCFGRALRGIESKTFLLDIKDLGFAIRFSERF